MPSRSTVSGIVNKVDFLSNTLWTNTDFDMDGFVGQSDLKFVIKALTRNELTPDEHQQIAEKVIEEADVDGDGKLSFLEFEHVITRAPDFLSTFHIRL